MKKMLLISMLLLTVGVYSQTESADGRAEVQHKKISANMDLTDAQSAFLMTECKDYQTKVTNLRKDKDSMEEEEFHSRMKEYRLSFYNSFKGELNEESNLSSWNRMNIKLLEK